MVGANYMGGKRNHVRIKGKDRETRLQKSFFGKQRLQMLSKGLSSRSDSVEGPGSGIGGASSRASASIADISLAHARQKNLPDATGKSNASRSVSWIPEPEYVPGSAFGSGSSPVRGMARLRKAHTPSSRSKTKAGIFQKLDTAEPFCLKQLLERIRTTPDLAGLSRKSAINGSSTSQNILVPARSTGRTRERDVRSEERQTPEGDFSFGVEEADEQFKVPAWHVDSGDPAYDNSDSYPVHPSPAFSPYHASDHRFIDDAMDGDFDSPTFSSMEVPDTSIIYEQDVRYFDGHRSVTAASSSSRPFQLLSSPPTSVGKPAKGITVKSTRGHSRHATRSRSWDTAVETPRAGSSPRNPEEPKEGSKDGSLFDERGLPSVIRLPKPTDKAVNDKGSVYGSLFTYSDPWSVIGEILSQGGSGDVPEHRGRRGRPDGEVRMRSRSSEWTTSLIDEEGTKTSEDEEDSVFNMLEGDRPFEELEFEDVEDDQGLGPELDKYEELEAMLGVEELAYGLDNTNEQNEDPYQKFEPGVFRYAIRNEFQGPDFGSSDGMLEDQVIRRYSPSPTFEHALEHNEKRPKQHTDVDDTHNSPCQSVGTPPTMDLQRFHCSPLPAQCGGKIIESGPGATKTDAEGSAQELSALNLWAAPELEERNGKFVGPSLFDDDEDDEDV